MTSAILQHSECRLTFHLFLSGLDDEDQYKFDLMAKIYRNVDLQYYNMQNYKEWIEPLTKLKTGYPVASLYRLLAAEILSPSISKILYLDGDVICKNDISALFHLNIDNAPLAAAGDINEKAFAKERSLKSGQYFNAGVLLINLDFWRKKGFFQVVLNFIEKNDKIVFPYADQDILNFILDGFFFRLEDRFNRQIACNCRAGKYKMRIV